MKCLFLYELLEGGSKFCFHQANRLRIPSGCDILLLKLSMKLALDNEANQPIHRSELNQVNHQDEVSPRWGRIHLTGESGETIISLKNLFYKNYVNFFPPSHLKSPGFMLYCMLVDE